MKPSTIDKISNDIIDELQRSFTQDEITNILQRVAFQFGFEHFTYARIFPKAMTRLDIIIIGNYPTEWAEEYINNKYIFVDPTIKHCASSALPYYWENIFTNKDEEVIKFGKACSGFGLKDGFSIGLNGNCGDFSIISFGKSEVSANPQIEYNQPVKIGHLILPYVHEKFAQINPVSAIYPTSSQHNPNSPLQELTAREKECLLWTAEGKTAYEISKILKISESTVNFHLKNITIKLDCANKTHAVAKAVLLGLNKNMTEHLNSA